MTLTTDEQAMRTALQELAVGQPDAPVDRLAGVRRHHLRRRRAQGAAGLLAFVAVIAGVMAGNQLSGTARDVAPTHRAVPSWALPWPEQRGPEVGQATLDRIVRLWQQREGNGDGQMFAPRQMIWYLAVPVLDHRNIAFVFEVERDDGEHRLVAGFVEATPAIPGQDQGTFYDVSAPDPHADTPVAVSFYLPATGIGEPVPNGVVLLTDPSVDRATFRERTVIDADLRNGLVAVEFGPVRGPVSVVLHRPGKPDVAVGDVGLAGAPDSQVPQVEPAGALQGVAAGLNVMGPFGGQGPSILQEMSASAGGPTTVYGRCYGGPTVRLAIDRDGNGSSVSLPCDGRQHVVTGPRIGVGGKAGHTIYVQAGRLVAYQLAVVIR